jgi:hypothetical protein
MEVRGVLTRLLCPAWLTPADDSQLLLLLLLPAGTVEIDPELGVPVILYTGEQGYCVVCIQGLSCDQRVSL